MHPDSTVGSIESEVNEYDDNYYKDAVVFEKWNESVMSNDDVIGGSTRHYKSRKTSNEDMTLSEYENESTRMDTRGRSTDSYHTSTWNQIYENSDYLDYFFRLIDLIMLIMWRKVTRSYELNLVNSKNSICNDYI